MVCSAMTWAGFQLLTAKPQSPRWILGTLFGTPAVFVFVSWVQAYKMICLLLPNSPETQNRILRYLANTLIVTLALVASGALFFGILAVWFYGAFRRLG
jgi:hypothetical protein